MDSHDLGLYVPGQPYVLCPTPWDTNQVACYSDGCLAAHGCLSYSVVYPVYWYSPGCVAAHAYEKKANKKKRPATHKKKNTPSDGKTLEDREEDARRILKSIGVDYATLTITQALTMHQEQHRTAEEKLALRVSIAEKIIDAETHEERAIQFAFFEREMERSPAVTDSLRAPFLKAAHHRMQPWKHAAKHMQK